MITEDYILKLIRLATEFIAKALGLAKEGDFLTSEQTMDNGIRDLTGLSLETLKTLDSGSLVTMLGDDAASVYILAEFLKAVAGVELQKGSLDLYYIYLEKSLGLYLAIRHYGDLETEKPIIDIYKKIKEVITDVILIKELIEFFKTREDEAETAILSSFLEQ